MFFCKMKYEIKLLEREYLDQIIMFFKLTILAL